ncbi:MAG: cysteine desulfurase NifS [Clostridia bacterium]|jgi:cysteine desulfurase|nr:cysteine desulfurase NifS [Clostridia bacterium]
MIYLDYNATTPIDNAVADAMLPYLYGHFGNPSSSHELGIEAKKAIENSRKQVANLLGCTPNEIVFTSGGSESNNTVIKGVAHTYKNKGNHIITSKIEHPAIINPCKYLESIGYDVSYVPVDQYGMVNPSDVEKLITDQTILVTIMHSNDEVGTIQPIEEISSICKKYNVLFHTDASQSIGKVPINVESLGVDFLTVAGHKLYAPKGIGALFIRNGIHIESLIHGAGHESGRRAGTDNIILEVGLGKACEISAEALKSSEIKKLTEYFYDNLKERFGDRIHLNGHSEKRLPNTLNVSFLGYNGHEVLNQLEETAASTGSACHSGMTSISPVLNAMGVTEDVGRGAVRFSLGRYTTKDEIDSVISNLNKIVILHFPGNISLS